MHVVFSRPSVLAVSAKPAAKPAAKPVRAARLKTRGVPKKEAIYEAIREAEQTCASASAADCAVAWDIVEELSAAASRTGVDPLEDERVDRCEADPSFDPECRMYDI
jgi:hypothetical protein